MKKMMVTGVVSATILGGLLFATQSTEAANWIANTPESLSIQSGQTSYTLQLGDTLWAISQRTNLTVQTLADVNNINLALGEQYNLPVGRTIYFDGNKVTVKEADGSVVKETIVTDESKVDSSKEVGESVVNGTQMPSLDLPSNGGTVSPTPENPGNDGEETPKPEVPTDPEKPTEPENPVDPTDPEVPEEKVYRGEFISGVDNGAVGTWTNKDEMVAYIEANWDAKLASGEWTEDYGLTTNGYGWIAYFY